MIAKDDKEKLRLSWVPRGIVEAIATIRAYGNRKYGNPDNWRLVDNQRYWDAALRHAEAAREDYMSIDQESGYPHIYHMACNLAFIIARMEDSKSIKKTGEKISCINCGHFQLENRSDECEKCKTWSNWAPDDGK